MALVATAGASNANSYLTLLEFNAYLTTRPHVPATVTDADNSMKEAALIMATRLLNNVCYLGMASSATQRLTWPRIGLFNRNGYPLSEAIIPEEVKEATAEMAFLLMQTDRTLENRIGELGLMRLEVADAVEMWFKEDNVKNATITTTVRDLLVPSWLCPEPNNNTVLFDMV